MTEGNKERGEENVAAPYLVEPVKEAAGTHRSYLCVRVIIIITIIMIIIIIIIEREA